jgi:P2 family phage contractile tail tube protein
MKVSKVLDANVYVNNESAHGQASEVTCPEVTPVMSEHNSLGSIGTLKTFAKKFEAMEATIKWSYAENDVLKSCGNFSKPMDIMVRSNKSVFDSGMEVTEIPVVIYMKGVPTKHVSGTFKSGESTEGETTLAVHYLKQEVDGEEIIEVDIRNNIYKVNGEDLLAEYKQNLGI